MDTDRPGNPQKLISLKDAAQILAVSVEVLLEWNEHNILKPTITTQGNIGYTQTQLDQFITIRQLSLQAPSQSNTTQLEADYPKVIKNSEDNSSYLPKAFIFLASLSIALTIILFPSPDIKTSKLKLSENVLAALPIKLSSEASGEKIFQNIGESIIKEKLTVPSLYETKRDGQWHGMGQTEHAAGSDKTLLSEAEGSQAQQATATPHLNESAKDIPVEDIDFSNSFASVAFPDTCESCMTDEESPIDERGQIKGEAKTDLYAIIEGIDGMIKSGSTNQPPLRDSLINTNITNQIIILIIGSLAILFMFQKQFAYPDKKSQPGPIDRQPNQANNVSQKILEIDQKTDGTVVLLLQGTEHKISKPEMNSESDRFIEKLMELTKSGRKEIEYDMLRADEIRFSTPLSRLVTRLGFVGIKRDLFFPRTSKTGVLFRKYLTESDLSRMNLTTGQILNDLQNQNSSRPTSTSNLKIQFPITNNQLQSPTSTPTSNT
jgi:hypothetical protein